MWNDSLVFWVELVWPLLVLFGTVSLALAISIKAKFETYKMSQNVWFEQRKALEHQFRIGIFFLVVLLIILVLAWGIFGLEYYFPDSTSKFPNLMRFLYLPVFLVIGLILVSISAIQKRISLFRGKFERDYPTGKKAVWIGIIGIFVSVFIVIAVLIEQLTEQ